MVDWEDCDEVFVFTMDGVHCICSEPRTYTSQRHFSHKSNGPAIAYEVVVAIHHNQIVWTSGPFEPATHDLTIYKMPGGLKEQIPDDKLGTKQA
jgi:hypothetical protein